MRALPVVALCAWLACTGAAMGQANSLLWRIRGDGIEGPAYVFGTVHSRDARAYRGNDSLWAAMAVCDEVMGELDHAAVASAAMAMLAAMQMPDGGTLADLYRRKDLDRVHAALRDHLGIMAAAAHRMKPFWTMALLAETVMRKDSAMVLDEAVQSRARAAGKRTGGLESVEEQLAAVDAVPLKDQAAMLLGMVRADLHRRAVEDMMEAYARQDLDALQATVRESGLPASMDTALLARRNARLAARMAERLREGCRCLFAVGAAHLPGPGGVLERLRAEGFTLTPVAPAR